MKKIKFILVILPLFLIILVSCFNNMYKVNSNDVKKIHGLIENLNVFEKPNSYLTTLGNVYIEETEENYKLDDRKYENINKLYEYNKQEKVLYKGSEKVEENISLTSRDEFAKYVISLIDPNFYCISINEFVPFIKEIYLDNNDFKHSGNRAGKIYYSCEIKGTILLNDKNISSLLEKMDIKNQIKDADSIELGLLFATDFSQIYPVFEMSKDNNIIFSFD